MNWILSEATLAAKTSYLVKKSTISFCALPVHRTEEVRRIPALPSYASTRATKSRKPLHRRITTRGGCLFTHQQEVFWAPDPPAPWQTLCHSPVNIFTKSALDMPLPCKELPLAPRPARSRAGLGQIPRRLCVGDTGSSAAAGTAGTVEQRLSVLMSTHKDGRICLWLSLFLFRKLAGCTLFITGASRGIGKAIALKAAKDGANIVIAAKTAEPHPRLPGTIYTAAAEIEAAGGKALPCIVNVREEQQIINAVEKAVKTFGGIDILVNNASAISLTGTLETETKKVNLMMDVNVRGTYLTSKTCLPHLRKSRNPHILNLSPPMNLKPMWFKNHCAYTISKYGMSMCVLGMAEEFRGEVAVNALWPKTAIHTAAMDMLGGSGIEKQCRKTDILADAAYCILTKPKSFTGNFIIDEVLLREEGVKDFDVYAVAPGHPLMPDFFLDVEIDVAAMKQEKYGASQAVKEEKKLSASQHEGPGGAKANAESAAAKPLSPVAETFRVIQGAISEEYVRTTQGVFQFELSGDEGGTWYIDLKTQGGSAGFGRPPVTADVVMSMSSADFVKMFTGKLKPTLAFMSGKLRIKGNMALAIKLEKMLTQLNSKL